MPSNRTPRLPRAAVDPDGTPIYFLPLANYSHPVRINVEVGDELIAAGFSLQCTLNSNGHGNRYARCHAPVGPHDRNYVSLARLIMGVTEPGWIVRFCDGNPLNLRLDNLYVERGPAGVRERNALLIAQHRQADWVRETHDNPASALASDAVSASA